MMLLALLGIESLQLGQRIANHCNAIGHDLPNIFQILPAAPCSFDRQ